MEAEYETRKRELLEECTVASEIFERVLPRLERFMKPFADHLVRKEQRRHVRARLALESQAQEYGIDRLSIWPAAHAVAMVRRHV